MSDIRRKAAEGCHIGDTFTVTRCFSERDMEAFAQITRDYNPIHFDERFSDVKRFSGRICHGLLVASILTEIGGQVGWLASRMDFRYKRPVYFGDTVTCVLTITDIDERLRAKAEAVYTNQDGDIVITADLAGIVPGEPERSVLKEMIREGDPTNKT